MTQSEALYKDYWLNSTQEREKRAYYRRLYGEIVSKIIIDSDAKVLDVAGGNGQFSRFLGLKKVDILDISASGIEEARKSGFDCIQADVERRFPVAESSYDVALCFEVLEHLNKPNITLTEIHHVLKTGGAFYIGQPNMRADGVYHVRRYRPRDVLIDLNKTGFRVEWVDYVPAYSMPEAIRSDIRNNPSYIRKCVQCVNLALSLLPYRARYWMAKIWPDQFALLVVVKAIKD